MQFPHTLLWIALDFTLVCDFVCVGMHEMIAVPMAIKMLIGIDFEIDDVPTKVVCIGSLEEDSVH
jgi:hypothetical protein